MYLTKSAKMSSSRSIRQVDVNESEVGALVAKGYLPEGARGDPVAIKAAIEGVISDLAFELELEGLRQNL
jgi:hypothetical protein